MELNKNLELEIEKEAIAIENRVKSLEELNNKIAKLQLQVNNLQVGFEKSAKRIEELGAKTARRDGKTETAEALNKKQTLNEDLLKLKMRTLKQKLDAKNPAIWAAFEKSLPDKLRGIGIED